MLLFFCLWIIIVVFVVFCLSLIKTNKLNFSKGNYFWCWYYRALKSQYVIALLVMTSYDPVITVGEVILGVKILT